MVDTLVKRVEAIVERARRLSTASVAGRLFVACMNKMLSIPHAVLRDGANWREHLPTSQALSN